MKFNCGQSIMHLQISGHKRVDSVNAYADLAEEESIALGRVLGRPTPSNYNAAMRQSVPETGESTTTKTNSLSGPTPSTSTSGNGQTLFQNCTIQHLSL